MYRNNIDFFYYRIINNLLDIITYVCMYVWIIYIIVHKTYICYELLSVFLLETQPHIIYKTPIYLYNLK